MANTNLTSDVHHELNALLNNDGISLESNPDFIIILDKESGVIKAHSENLQLGYALNNKEEIQYFSEEWKLSNSDIELLNKSYEVKTLNDKREAQQEMLFKGREGVSMTTLKGATILFNEDWNNAQILNADGSTTDLSGKKVIEEFAVEHNLTDFEVKTLNDFEDLGASIKDPDGSIAKGFDDYIKAEDKRIATAAPQELNKMNSQADSKLTLDLKDNSKMTTPSPKEELRDNATPKADLIGSKMPIAEWQEAIKLVGGKSGHIYIPKQNGQYSGKIILVSDTHLVQQVGKNIAIAHEISKLANKSEIDAMADIGKLQNKNFDIKYNDKVGEALPISFNERRAGEVKEKAFEWAEKNISDTKSRDVFLKHIEAFAKKLAEPSFAKVAKDTAAPSVPTPSNQHTQKR